MSRPWTPLNVQRLRELHAAGKADGEIARALGCSRDVVLYRRRALGLKSRWPQPVRRIVLAPGMEAELDRVWRGLSAEEKFRLLARVRRQPRAA